jgi:hypothetical protein
VREDKTDPWELTVKPACTPAEAEAAAERARKLVAGWLRQQQAAAEAQRQSCP